MANYGDLAVATKGMKADMSVISKVETAFAQDAMGFGEVAWTYGGDIQRVGNRKLDTVTLVFDKDLVAEDVTTITAQGVALPPVTWVGSHLITMNLIVAGLNAAGCTASLLATDLTNRTIVVTKKFETLVVTGVTRSPLYARSKIAADADLIAANSTVVTINGVPLAPVVYDGVSHLTTMQLIIAAVIAAGYECELDLTDATNRTIIIKKDYEAVVATMVTTDGLTQAVWTTTAVAAYVTPTITPTSSSIMVDRGLTMFIQKEQPGYKVNDDVSLAILGSFWVQVANNVQSLDDCYVILTGADAGKFTNVVGSNHKIEGTFMSNASTGGLAQVNLFYMQ